jgi:hypothetical protein
VIPNFVTGRIFNHLTASFGTKRVPLPGVDGVEPHSVSQLEVVVSELGEDAAAVGAATLTSKQVLDNLCVSIQMKGLTRRR